MRRSLMALALTVLCAAAPPAFGQVLGVVGGVGYGSTPGVNSGVPGDLRANSGVAVGLSLEGYDAFGLGMNALISQRGYTNDVPGGSQRLTYLDVPVYLKLSAPSSSVTPFALVGPQASYELNCDGGECPAGRTRMLYSGVVGAGLKFARLRGVSIQGRYAFGFNNLNYTTATSTANYKTQSFMLLAGVGF
jgi:hypothetical protein